MHRVNRTGYLVSKTRLAEGLEVQVYIEDAGVGDSEEESFGRSNTTNTDRTLRCHSVLTVYNDEDDLPATLIDLLADARHWCNTHGENFAELSRIAYEHYLQECHAPNGRRP